MPTPSYIYPAPGVPTKELTVTLSNAVGYTGTLAIPALQDVTINNSVDSFTWTQLDQSDKLSVPTTAANSVSGTIVVDKVSFFGDSTAADGTIAKLGILGLSQNKVQVQVAVYMGDTNAGLQGNTLTATGYVTGLSPTVSADQPVWTSPITITVSGSFIVS